MRYLYLHGFASGPDSAKGVAVAEHLARRGVHVERLNLRVPSFEHLRGSAMIDLVRETLAGEDGVLIGSSLGGWTALRAAERCPNVRAVVVLAPAIGLAAGWRRRMPTAVERWEATGWLSVEDHALGGMARVDIGFLEDIERIDAAGDPSVNVPVLIVHGRRDDVVPVSGSRRWASEREHVRLVEVDDGHQLTDSLSTILAELDAFLDRSGASGPAPSPAPPPHPELR